MVLKYDLHLQMQLVLVKLHELFEQDKDKMIALIVNRYNWSVSTEKLEYNDHFEC